MFVWKIYTYESTKYCSSAAAAATKLIAALPRQDRPMINEAELAKRLSGLRVNNEMRILFVHAEKSTLFGESA